MKSAHRTAELPAGRLAIVTMASSAGVRGVTGIAGYVAEKHAIVGLTETVALDEVEVALGVPGEKTTSPTGGG